jgi:two-component system response regulator PrrA
VARILIVDDDPVVSLTLSRMLQWAGHTAWLADSARAGLDRVAREAPDAILLDMRMPGMGGLEFLRELRTSPAHAALPVGIVTGDYFMDEQVLAELERLGATVRYKPIWVEDLTALLGLLLGERPSTAANH